jgi:hypothetical protein
MKPFLMSRLDFDVKVIELPRLGEKEIEGFLKYRIAGLYPGHPEQTAYDYRILEWKKTRYAVLFLTRRATLEAYRADAGDRALVLQYLFVQPYLKEILKEDGIALIVAKDCIEALVFRNGASPAVSLWKRTKRLAADIAKIRRSLSAEEGQESWILFHEAEDEAGLSSLSEFSPRMIRIEEAIDRLGPGEHGLFAAAQRLPRVPRGLQRQLLAMLLLFLAWLLLAKLTDREETYMHSLMRQAGLLQSRSEAVIALQAEIETLSRQKARLIEKRPIDPYRLLSELQLILAPEVRIQALLLERSFFQFEAVGPNPLPLMDRFRQSALFLETRLLQTAPESGSKRERFKITGSVHAE